MQAVILILLFAVASIGSQQSCADEAVKIGEQFDVQFNHTALIQEINTSITFQSVLQDSRCPKGVQCIAAGNAKIEILVREGQKEPVSIQLNTADGAGEAQFGNYLIQLVDLKPYPSANQQSKSEEYIATFHVAKNGSS